MNHSDDPFDDGDAPGDYESRYPEIVWKWIRWEYTYLLGVLALSSLVLLTIGYDVTATPLGGRHTALLIFEYPQQRTVLIWIATAFAGVCGGTLFALKVLYHVVAKRKWRYDRYVWRFTVPLISGVLAVFVIFMIASGLVSFFKGTTFQHFYPALGCAFLVGYFSDNVLASLQRVAVSIFGTLSGVDTLDGSPVQRSAEPERRAQKTDAAGATNGQALTAQDGASKSGDGPKANP